MSAREVMLKVGVRHPVKDALDLFSREVAPMALMTSPAITGFTGGRPEGQTRVRLFSCLGPKHQPSGGIDMGAQQVAPPQRPGHPPDMSLIHNSQPPTPS